MEATSIFQKVIEDYYALKIKNIDHKIATGKWVYKKHFNSITFFLKPKKRTFFEAQVKLELEQIRLFTLAVELRVCYHSDRILFIFDCLYNCPTIANDIKSGINEFNLIVPGSNCRFTSELILTDLTANYKVKRRLNSLLKWILKDFSLS